MLYNPSMFREDRPEVLAQMIKQVQFAALVTPLADGLQISHVPMLLKNADGPFETWILDCHIARPNPHRFAALSAVGETAALFQGPQTYISPSWYPSKQEHGKVVPTWNYAVVHVHGTLELIDEPKWLLNHLADITDENEHSQPKPWHLTDAPADYIEDMIKALIGVRLHVSRVDGKWKMSQNRNKADRDGVLAGLSASPDQNADVERIMRQLYHGA